MSVVAQTEDRLKPWEMSWNGRTWHEMPGQDFEIKKMNFYLFRTGHLKLEDVQYIGLDDVVRTRTVTVMPVSFGRMGLVKGLEEQAERKKAELQNRRESVADAQARREWKLALQARLQKLTQAHYGALRQLALSAGLTYDNVLKFSSGGTKLGMEKLKRLDELLQKIENGEFVLPRATRTKKPVPCPAGHVPFKTYVKAVAARWAMKPHSFYAWLQRNPQAKPPIFKVHGRAWFVPESAMPREDAA